MTIYKWGFKLHPTEPWRMAWVIGCERSDSTWMQGLARAKLMTQMAAIEAEKEAIKYHEVKNG